MEQAGILHITNYFINKRNGHFLIHNCKYSITIIQILTLQIYSSIPKD